MLKSIEGNFDNPEVNEMLVKHFIELRSVSPEGSAHVLDIAGLKDPTIKFWSLWENEQLMGSGALKFLDEDHGEFKSIRINDKFRKKGNGIKVINHLIDEAKKLNIKKLSLETGAGVFFNPARKLFTKSGFKVCEPFSHYEKDINSVYMCLLISN
ncbi:GNAT family N-acetyltransferase [Pelagibacterales bacterium SAG-MED20]|nr:GNAT family N-acetyltransferase [Pelagibacterales bacterium SAG-MED20]